MSLFEGEVGGIGGPAAKLSFRDADGHDLAHDAEGKKTRILSADDAIQFVARAVAGPELPKIEAIGYRVVHPGAKLRSHQRITDEVLEDIRNAAEFAPLHDPAVVKIIEAMRTKFPDARHYACFDTVFHETMPPEAKIYALPGEYAKKGVRRYGFHGLSCESIVAQIREAGIPMPHRMAIAHLGGGCSVTALLDGVSIDTSMGLTPTGGVVMTTRPGDLDPGLMLYLLRQSNGDAGSVEKMLNHASGLAALSETSGDMREVRAAATKDDERAILALKVFTRTVKKALGSYIALMGGLDTIVFAGGIGEHDAASRTEILAGMEPLGIQLDTERNAGQSSGLRRVTTDTSATAVYVIPAEEDVTIARHVAQMSESA